MKLIPVIDLRAGQVVRAVRGERAGYRPVQSALCDGSEPAAVARALLDHCAADTLYVADLDALTGGGIQAASLAALCRALPGIELWLDAGFADLAGAHALRDRLARQGGRVTPVLASEALRDLADLQRAERDWILSLDCKGGAELDRAGCWQHPDLWPARLIVMTLDRVGAQQGPDLDTLLRLRSQARASRLYGAGGVRDESDLRAAEAAGAVGWLLASALHDRRIPPARRPGPAREAT